MLLLRDLDLFKAVPETRFRGQKGGHSSIFGRALTLCILGSSIGLLIYFSLDMILKTNPQIQTFNAVSNDDLILTNQTFPFAFALRDINGTIYVDENIYTLGAYFALSGKNISLTLCRPTEFKGIYDPEKEGPVWCFSDKQEAVKEIGISGKGGIVINLQRCNPNKNSNCRNATEIDQITYNSRLRILYHDVTFTPENYDHPIDETPRSWDPSVCKTVVKQNALFLSQTYFLSDNGWLLKNVRNVSKISFDDRIQYFEDNSIMGDVFNVIYIRTYGQTRTTQRIYDNVQTILARWNAIFTLLIIIGKIASDSYNKFKTQETLVQDIFFLKQKKLKKQKGSAKLSFRSQSKSRSVIESLGSPIPTEQNNPVEFMVLPSIEGSPIQMPKKMSANDEMQAMSDSPVLFNDLKTMGKTKINRKNIAEKDIGQEKLNQTPSINGLLNRMEIEPKSRIKDHQKFDLKIDIEDIEVNTGLKADSNSPSPSKSPKFEAASPQKNEKVQKERTKRDLFKDSSEVNFCTWLISKVRKSEQYKLHLNRESIIQEEFDFQNYAKRFIGIDVLKYLLLSKDQLKVFDNCVKAYVNLKLDTLTRGSATDDAFFDELRTMFNTKGFPAEVEDEAHRKLKETINPDETTKKALNLLEVLFERET